MPCGRPLKQGREKDQRATETPRRTKKKAKSAPLEELGPERRSELTQQIEAKRSRGKPPSI
jgi:hypothetical protein